MHRGHAAPHMLRRGPPHPRKRGKRPQQQRHQHERDRRPRVAELHVREHGGRPCAYGPARKRNSAWDASGHGATTRSRGPSHETHPRRRHPTRPPRTLSAARRDERTDAHRPAARDHRQRDRHRRHAGQRRRSRTPARHGHGHHRVPATLMAMAKPQGGPPHHRRHRLLGARRPAPGTNQPHPDRILARRGARPSTRKA